MENIPSISLPRWPLSPCLPTGECTRCCPPPGTRVTSGRPGRLPEGKGGSCWGTGWGCEGCCYVGGGGGEWHKSRCGRTVLGCWWEWKRGVEVLVKGERYRWIRRRMWHWRRGRGWGCERSCWWGREVCWCRLEEWWRNPTEGVEKGWGKGRVE